MLKSGATASAAPAFQTDSDLTLADLHIEWSTASTTDADFDTSPSNNAAVSSTGGVLRVHHCEIVVGRQSVCVSISGASGELAQFTAVQPEPVRLLAADERQHTRLGELHLHRSRCHLMRRRRLWRNEQS